MTNKKSKKLWQELGEADQQIERFTVGRDRELDLRLAPFDVLGSLAHGAMLHKVGLLPPAEYGTIRAELLHIYGQIESGQFVIEDGVEDVHSQIELQLTRQLAGAGKKIHTGRSRNDQVLLDLRLYCRDWLMRLLPKIGRLFDNLLMMSEKYKDAGLPGYTHMQVAMPSSFGLWFAAFAESLVDDVIQFQAAFRIINKNPLGSAAGYGSSFPLDRGYTTTLLGFEALNYNSVYAQMGRGRTERVMAQAMASLAETVGRLAMDITLFSSQNYNFIRLPETFTTGSSIMPHKRNPDVAELLRGRCNMIRALPNELMMLTTNLPGGYHRDYQLLKESFLPALTDLDSALDIIIRLVPGIEVRPDILDDPIYGNLYTVEAVNRLVLAGVPFRDAYRRIATAVKEGRPIEKSGLNYSHEGSPGNLCNDKIRELMNQALAGFHFDAINKAIDHLLNP